MPVAVAGPGAAGTPCALRCARLADPPNLEAGQPRPPLLHALLGAARINHVPHPCTAVATVAGSDTIFSWNRPGPRASTALTGFEASAASSHFQTDAAAAPWRTRAAYYSRSPRRWDLRTISPGSKLEC